MKNSLTTVILSVLAILLPISTSATAIPWFPAERPGVVITNENIELIETYSDIMMVDDSQINTNGIECDRLYYVDLASLGFNRRSELLKSAADHELAFYHGTDPAGLTAYRSNNQVALHWQEDVRFRWVTSRSIDGYRVYRRLPGYAWGDPLVTLGSEYRSYNSNLPNPIGPAYEYKITSIINNTEIQSQYEVQYSWTCSVNTSASTPPLMLWLDAITKYEDYSGVSEGQQHSGSPYTFSVNLHANEDLTGRTVTVQWFWRNDNGDMVLITSNNATISGYTASSALSVPWARLLASGFVGCRAVVAGVTFPLRHFPSVPETYTCSCNNRIIGGSYRAYITNPASSEWQDVYNSEAQAYLAQDFQGVFGDNAFTEIRGWFGDKSTLVELAQSGATYESAMLSMLRFVRSRNSTTKIYVNNINSLYLDATARLDGVLTELHNFSAHTWAAIAGTLQAALEFTGRPLDVVCHSNAPLLTPDTTPDFDDARIYDLATYLMVVPAPTSGPDLPGRFGYFPVGKLRLYPEQFLDLGLPFEAPDFSTWISELPLGGENRDNPCLPPTGDPLLPIQSRRWQHGLVILNIQCGQNNGAQTVHFGSYWGSDLPQTLYYVKTDYPSNSYPAEMSLEIPGGGRLKTEAVSTATDFVLRDGYAAIFLDHPIESPKMDETAWTSVVADGNTPCVIMARNTSPEPLSEVRVYDYQNALQINLNGPLLLFDDGPSGGHGDLVSGDEVYTVTTSSPLPSSVGGRMVPLRLWAQSENGLLTVQDFYIPTLTSASVVRYERAPASLTYSGQATAAAAPDYDYVYVENPPARYADLLVGAESGGSKLYQTRSLAGHLPIFYDATEDEFYHGPADQLGGVTYADFDNDGDLDVFCAAGSAAAALGVIYERTDIGGGEKAYVNRNQELGLLGLANDGDEYVAHSWTGVWGDYDKDGWVDLFIVRSGDESGSQWSPPDCYMMARTSYLFRNTLGDATPNGFVNVTEQVGLAGYCQPTTVSSRSACWGDVNGDGRLDLYLACAYEGVASNPPSGPPPPGWTSSRLFIQQLDGTFNDETFERLSYNDAFVESGCAFADLNLDGSPDLIVSKYIWAWAAAVYYNDGSGHFNNANNVEILDSIGGTSGLQIVDHDRDGRQDLLLIPSNYASRPGHEVSARLYANRLMEGRTRLVDISTVTNIGAVAIGASLTAHSLSLADWDQDGDSDVFFGRPIAGSSFYYNAKTVSGESPAGNYIAIQLEADGKENNVMAIGAKIECTDSGRYMTQWVDGGSGAGTQHTRVLTFPVSSSGDIPITITWPNGYVQETVVAAQSNAGYRIVVDGTTPTIADNTVKARTEYKAEENKFYWVFTWQTQYISDKELDKVTLNTGGLQYPCFTQYTEFVDGMANVSVEDIVKLPSGLYGHVLRAGIDCAAPCNIPYTVTSVRNDEIHNQEFSSTCATKTLKVKYCPLQL